MALKNGFPALSQRRDVRFVTFAALYAAQGVPEGLLYVAVPAWLAQQGVSAAAIGGYIGIILIPWSLKLINGALMERWSFLAMGRRRPWVLLAQLGLSLTLFAMSAIADPVNALFAVTVFGVLVNTFGAFQDVAVDGMAIDVFPQDEYARANGVMWGAKTLGIAGASAGSAWLLHAYGWRTASIGIGVAVAAIMVLPLIFRERPGERLLPWTLGAAAASTQARVLGGWRPIITHLLRAALRPQSLWLIAAIFIALASYGLFISTMPVVTVQNLGWRDTTFSHTAAAANFVGGIYGIILAGLIADRLGPARALIGALALIAALHAAVAMWPGFTQTHALMAAYIVIFQVLFVQMSVAIYALAMRASDIAIAATHFAFFMAFVNLGTSAGAALLGPLRGMFALPGLLAAMALLAVLAIVPFSRLRAS